MHPVTPDEAVRGLLDALDVPAERSRGLDAQAGLYRSLLAGQRVLIVLDNARDGDQVRPLLPGSPGCLVLVTSRNQLTGLVAADGARPVTLDVLSDAEARAAAGRRGGRRAGRRRAEARPSCHAVRVAAAGPGDRRRPRRHPARAPARRAGRRAARAAGRLDALETGDPAASVRAVFSWSYRQLSGAAARMFRLLGLHPGPDITVPAAASLAGASTSPGPPACCASWPART